MRNNLIIHRCSLNFQLYSFTEQLPPPQWTVVGKRQAARAVFYSGLVYLLAVMPCARVGCVFPTRGKEHLWSPECNGDYSESRSQH
jgi:hypothetical protein